MSENGRPARVPAALRHTVLFFSRMLAALPAGSLRLPEAHGRALAFATLSTSLLLHAFSDRSPRPFRGWAAGRNPTLLLCVGTALLLQLLALTLLQLPGGELDWDALPGARKAALDAQGETRA